MREAYFLAANSLKPNLLTASLLHWLISPALSLNAVSTTFWTSTISLAVSVIDLPKARSAVIENTRLRVVSKPSKRLSILFMPFPIAVKERFTALLAVPAVLLNLFNLRVAVLSALLRLSTLPVIMTRNSSIVILPHLRFQAFYAVVRYGGVRIPGGKQKPYWLPVPY